MDSKRHLPEILNYLFKLILIYLIKPKSIQKKKGKF